ncbi:MAG: hypothetical protein V4773_17010 [Verrucomicrobiota bacterium]
MNHEKRPVSLEDLLRLKRTERPAAEFWGEFDRQLRAKQLAALVEKRPWWHGLQSAVFQLGRYRLPLGAAAAVALTVVVVRNQGFSGSAAHEAQALAPVAVATVAATHQVSVQPAATPAATERALGGVERSSNLDTAAGNAAGEAAPSAEYAVVAPSPSRKSQGTVASFDSVMASSASSEAETPSARFIAANLAALQVSDSLAASLLNEPHGFESRGLPARTPVVEPLQQMTPPGESRRPTRYLATMVSMNNAAPTARTSERVANRISNEELYDEVHRFTARRGGFNVKF